VKGRKPLTFRFGKKQIIEGLESVVGNMQAGGQSTCNIPAKYAYGAKGMYITMYITNNVNIYFLDVMINSIIVHV
jgi:FKBP-type peptidyl-prolyl cis-trans isomerase